jgi:multiple sugar transport system substrate-binding protein
MLPNEEEELRMSLRRALIWSLCAIAVVPAIVLSGCGGDDDDGPAEVSGTVRMQHDVPPWQDGFAEMSPTLKNVTGVGWKPVVIPDATQHQQLAKQALRTGKNAPDILKWWSGYRLQELASAGTLTDLTSLWDEMVAKGWVTPGLKPAFSYEDKVYGLPFVQSYWVVFYNKKVFDEVGIEPPKTWDDFVSNAEKIKAAGVTPFYTTVQDRWPSFIWFEDLLAKRDPAAYDAVVSNQAKYTDPVVREAMGVWQDFIEKGYFTKPDVKIQDSPPQFKDGKFAMVIMGSWFNQQLAAAGMKPGEDYGVFIMPPMPQASGPSAFFESGVFTIPTNAPNKDAAMKLLQNWLNPEVQKDWADFTKDVPVNPTLSSSDPVIKDVQELLKTGDPALLNRYFEATLPAIVEGNIDFLGDFMLHPDTLDSTLESMQGLADKEWAGAGE